MKILVALFLVAGSWTAARARQAPAAATEGPPGLSVVKCEWVRERVPGWENRPTGAESYDMMRARVANEQQMQRDRNVGNKGVLARAETQAKIYERAAADNSQRAAAPQRFGYRYKTVVRNEGPAEVKSVDWDYIFLDPSTQAEVERHQFTSDGKIRPGKEKELSVFILTPPFRTISAHALGRKDGPPMLERVVLVRVVYADGTVWQRPQ